MIGPADNTSPWLTYAPSHWRVSPLGTHFAERAETVSDADFQPLSVTKSGVVPQLANVAKTANNDSRKLVRAGDFVINSRSDRKGSSGLADRNGSVSVINTVLTPRASVHGRFAHHLLRSSAFQEEFYRWGSGIVSDLWSTRYSTMKSIPLALPPLDKQRAIADYLDHETAQIDTLIAKQEQLIATLRERRLATVEQHVFGGLEHTPTRRTDEEWLPDVPIDWRVSQLGYIAESLPGWAFPSDGFTTDPRHVRLLRGVNVKPGGIDWSDVVYWNPVSSRVPEEFYLDAGDLVLGMDRPFVGGGVRVAVVDATDLPAFLLQRVMRMRPRGDNIDRAYLKYVVTTRAFLAYLEPLFTGVSVPHISEWQVRKFRLPLPSIDEQRRISAYLDEQTSKIDTLIAKTERFIELSKERRAALITAAVTGQIDVQESA